MDRENVLISGGTGFVGRNLIAVLSDDYNSINIGRNENNTCENVFWDLTSDFPQNRFADGSIGRLIHCASIVGPDECVPTERYFDINIKATARLLDFAIRNHVRHFVYISSGAVYGEAQTAFTENDECCPGNRYGISKYVSEMLCSHCSDKMSVTILRPFFPYGVGQTGRLIPKLMEQIISGHTVTMNAGGLPLINPIHISDFVSIAAQTIKQGISGIFNVSGDEMLSILDICERIRKKLLIAKPEYVFTDNTARNVIGSNRKICDTLNYKIRMSFDEGITELINGCQEKGDIQV